MVERVRHDVAIIQTWDDFRSLLIDARNFGAVAATLSDVYAMGGTPATALTIPAFGLGTTPDEILGTPPTGRSGCRTPTEPTHLM